MKLKVRAKWVIKTLDNSKVLVKEKDKIEKGDKLLVSNLNETRFVDLSSILTKVSKNKLDQLNKQLARLKVGEGDLLYETGGFFSKKIFSPYSGIIDGIDEFFNLRVNVELNEFREIYSPVKAKVDKVEKDKLILVFEAMEIEGRGLIEGKVWGEGLIKVDNISDLNNLLDKKMIIMSELAPAAVTKAEVVGVRGIITSENGEGFANIIKTSLPILVLSEGKLEDLIKNYEGKDVQVMMNSKIGRLLLVEEE